MRRLAAAAAAERAFEAYGRIIPAVEEFRYLGRVLMATDDDWSAVARNLIRARKTWGRLASILGREGADPKVSRMFYIAVTSPYHGAPGATSGSQGGR